MEIDKTFLNEIINSFADDHILFYNEAQFQFDLAWRIRERLGNDNAKIWLEKRMIENESQYTDIVIENSEQLIPVELKYKLADVKTSYSRQGEIINMSSQGAADNGCYDFWKDVERIEYLISKYENVHKGYAIIITNYSLYWGDGVKENSRWSDLCIKDGNSKRDYGALTSTGERHTDIKLKKLIL